jgi:hypothetical protein
LRRPRPSVSFANGLQLESKSFVFVAKSALAGLFAVLLLISATLAVSPAHRQFHNSDRTANGHQCVYCLLAHGQFAAADVHPPAIPRVDVCTVLVSPPVLAAVAAIDFRSSPCRAPPVSFSEIAVG